MIRYSCKIHNRREVDISHVPKKKKKMKTFLHISNIYNNSTFLIDTINSPRRSTQRPDGRNIRSVLHFRKTLDKNRYFNHEIPKFSKTFAIPDRVSSQYSCSDFLNYFFTRSRHREIFDEFFICTKFFINIKDDYGIYIDCAERSILHR